METTPARTSRALLPWVTSSGRISRLTRFASASGAGFRSPRSTRKRAGPEPHTQCGADSSAVIVRDLADYVTQRHRSDGREHGKEEESRADAARERCPTSHRHADLSR